VSAAAACFLPICPAAAQESLSAVVVRILDGDTIRVHTGAGEELVRLIGIDAPESHENDKAWRDSKLSGRDIKTILELGRQAYLYCTQLIHPGDRVTLQFDVQKRDKYNRLLAYVYLPNGSMLNERLLQDGYAHLMTIPPNVRHTERFKELFAEARRAKRGLWRDE